MSAALDLLDAVSKESGIGTPDPLVEVYKECLAEFEKLWTKDADGNWHKDCRIRLMPSSIGNGNSYGAEKFWGNESHGAYLCYDVTDSLILAPLGLQPTIKGEPLMYANGTLDEDAAPAGNTHTSRPIMDVIADQLGIHPQFLDFKTLMREGYTLTLTVSRSQHNIAVNRMGYANKSVAELVGGSSSELGSYAKRTEIKLLSIYMAWVFWGLQIPTSTKSGDMRDAIDSSICPPYQAGDATRARYILEKVNDIFGRKGSAARGKYTSDLVAMAETFDAELRSIGVEPPARPALKLKHIPKEGE
jgi:hypothetical protein